MKADQNPALTAQSHSVTSNRQVFWNWLQQIGESIVQSFYQQHELRIEQLIDRKGNTFWEVYDPSCQRTRQFYSETEVRRWLDRRSL